MKDYPDVQTRKSICYNKKNECFLREKTSVNIQKNTPLLQRLELLSYDGTNHIRFEGFRQMSISAYKSTPEFDFLFN